MAISKTQPMRPAEIELVDEVNRLTNASSSQAGQIASLNAAIETEALVRLNAVQDLQTQIGNGFAESSVTQSLSATNAQVLALTNDVDTLEQTALPGIQTQIDTINQTTIPGITTALGDTALLDDTVVNSILELATSEETLADFADRFKIGCINSITIPANDSISPSATFAEPFDANDICVLFAQVVTNELASLFTYTLIDCTYSGFSYSIANSDADAHTVSLGYVAVKVN